MWVYVNVDMPAPKNTATHKSSFHLAFIHVERYHIFKSIWHPTHTKQQRIAAELIIRIGYTNDIHWLFMDTDKDFFFSFSYW